MGTDQRRAAAHDRGTIWPPAHADGREHVSGSTWMEIAGREPSCRDRRQTCGPAVVMRDPMCSMSRDPYEGTTSSASLD